MKCDDGVSRILSGSSRILHDLDQPVAETEIGVVASGTFHGEFMLLDDSSMSRNIYVTFPITIVQLQ